MINELDHDRSQPQNAGDVKILYILPSWAVYIV